MSARPLPWLGIPRVLVPGTRAALPSSRADLAPGDEAVATLHTAAGDAAPRPVGTLVEVEALRPLGGGTFLLRLHGRRLVRVMGRQQREAGWCAEVTEIAEPGAAPPGLIETAERALRRYLALRVEAGEPADALVSLSRDPVRASHEVASLLRISWPEVQDILEAGGAADRLGRAQAVLERETELLRRLLGREGA